MFSNLVPHATYRLDWLASETWNGASVGTRKNTIDVNGVVVLEKFDILAETGASCTAVTKSFEVAADADGRLVVKMRWGGANNTRYGGLAVFGQAKPSDLQVAFDAETGRLDYLAKDALAYTVQCADAEEGPWLDIALNELAKDRPGSIVALGKGFYRVVASNGVGTVTSESVRGVPSAYALVDALYADPAYTMQTPQPLTEEQKASLWPFRSDGGMVTPKVYYSYPNFGKTLTMGESDWAPKNVYLTHRYFAGAGQVDVTFTNLTPRAIYRVDYLGTEYDTNARVGSRVFSIAINGQTVARDIDLYKEAGEKLCVASTRSYEAPADENGVIKVSFTATADCAKYGGLALWGKMVPHDVTLAYDETTQELVFSARDALLCRFQRSFASANGPWEDFATEFAADGATLRRVPANGEYFRVIASSGDRETASAAVKASVSGRAEDLTVYAWNLGAVERPIGRFATADGFVGLPEQGFMAAPTAESLRAVDMPAEVACSSLSASSLSYVLPNLRVGKTYQLKAYAVSGGKLSIDETLDLTDVSGDYAYAADGRKLVALELIEKASDSTPLKAVARAATVAGGVAVTPMAQCGRTTFEIRRDGVTVATSVGRTWFDRAGTASSSYSVRAVSPAGKAGDWSEAVTPTVGKAFLGVTGKASAVSAGGKTWESMLDFWVSNYNTRYDTTLNTAPIRGYLNYYDDFPNEVLYSGYWINNRTEGLKLCLTGLVPGLVYRIRAFTGDAYEGSMKVGGRVMHLRLNEHMVAEGIDSYKAHANGGTDRWIALEGQAVASGAGTIHLALTAEGDQWPQLCAVSATLEGPGSLAGPQTIAEDGARVADGWLTVPDTSIYTFRSAALADGALWIDDELVAGPVALGAGQHRFRFRSAADWTMTVESATIPATDVTAWLTHDPANDPSLGAGWQTTGSGDAYRVAMAANGPTWKLLAKDGVFAVCQTNVCSGEISFRVKFLRDYNEHGLSVAAFAGDSSVAVTATDNGPNGETLAGLPVWMKVHVSRTTITRSVSRDGSSWTELDSVSKQTDTVDLGVRISAPGEKTCQVDIDNVTWRVRRTPGIVLIFR